MREIYPIKVENPGCPPHGDEGLFLYGKDVNHDDDVIVVVIDYIVQSVRVFWGVGRGYTETDFSDMQISNTYYLSNPHTKEKLSLQYIIDGWIINGKTYNHARLRLNTDKLK